MENQAGSWGPFHRTHIQILRDRRTETWLSSLITTQSEQDLAEKHHFLRIRIGGVGGQGGEEKGRKKKHTHTNQKTIKTVQGNNVGCDFIGVCVSDDKRLRVTDIPGDALERAARTEESTEASSHVPCVPQSRQDLCACAFPLIQTGPAILVLCRWPG